MSFADDERFVLEALVDDELLISDLMQAMSYAAASLGHAYFRGTSTAIAIVADEMIKKGWPSRRPQSEVGRSE